MAGLVGLAELVGLAGLVVWPGWVGWVAWLGWLADLAGLPGLALIQSRASQPAKTCAVHTNSVEQQKIYIQRSQKILENPSKQNSPNIVRKHILSM